MPLFNKIYRHQKKKQVIFRFKRIVKRSEHPGTLRIIRMVFLIAFIFYSISAKAQCDSVKIGLLISDDSYRDAQRGVALAVKEANDDNLFLGRKIQLITRSMEGPWGTGAKQTVDLVFNEKVWGIIGSHDGRNAHLAEQVIAKTQVVYISAWSGDPTLAQAYVPWFFSVVPGNIQQAESLYNAVYYNGNPALVLAICDDSYDAVNELRFFMKETQRKAATKPEVIEYTTSGFDANNILESIKKYNPDVLILFGQPETSIPLQQSLHSRSINTKIFSCFSTLGEISGRTFNITDYKGALIPDIRYLNNREGHAFTAKFTAEYSCSPSPTAAYAYDAARLLLKQIGKSGFDRDRFKEQMRTTNEKGVTGILQFDELGNRIQPFRWLPVSENTLKPGKIE